MVINGYQVIIQYPVKTRQFVRWGLSKSKVGKRYVKLYRLRYDNPLPDGKAIVFENKILVTPEMYKALQDEYQIK